MRLYAVRRLRHRAHRQTQNKTYETYGYFGKFHEILWKILYSIHQDTSVLKSER